MSPTDPKTPQPARDGGGPGTQPTRGAAQDPELSAALAALAPARRLVAFTGAGMSADSGIATFRDALTGLWSRFDPQQLATRAGFEADPPLVWGWYEARRAQLLASEPHAGHRALARLLVHWGDGDRGSACLVTQNVDDLHERAAASLGEAAEAAVGAPVGAAGVGGTASGPLHLHGSLLKPRCLHCGAPHALHGAPAPMPAEGARRAPPRCADCGGPVRPGVVWFGESLPADVWRAAEAAVRACDALLVVGTSGVVQPAAGLTQLALRQGAAVCVVDPAPPSGGGQGRCLTLRGRAAERLPSLVDGLLARRAAGDPAPRPA